MNKFNIYKILIQSSLCWPQERPRLQWHFTDISKGKKHQGHSDIFAPHVLFLLSSLASMKVRNGFFI